MFIEKMIVVGWPQWFLLMLEKGGCQSGREWCVATPQVVTLKRPLFLKGPNLTPPNSRVPGWFYLLISRIAKAHRLLFVWSILEEEATVQARCIHAKERGQGCRGQGCAPVTQREKNPVCFFLGGTVNQEVCVCDFFCGGALIKYGWNLKWSCWKNMYFFNLDMYCYFLT